MNSFTGLRELAVTDTCKADAAAMLISTEVARAATPCVTTGLQLGGIVLLHLLKERELQVPVLLFDTGYLPEETLEFGHVLASLWQFDLRVVRPQSTVIEYEMSNGGPLYDVDPDRCCAERKVTPGHAALADHDVWLTAVRQTQNEGREAMELSSTVPLETGNDIRRVAPLAGWTWEDVKSYADEHQIPRHPLYSRGYTSIGCAPCTAPTWADTDDRSGRWNGAKSECGLHVIGVPPDSAE